MPTPDGPEAITHTHVDDVLSAFKKASSAIEEALVRLAHQIPLKEQTRKVCVVVEPSPRTAITSSIVTQSQLKEIDRNDISRAIRHLNRNLTSEKVTIFPKLVETVAAAGSAVEVRFALGCPAQKNEQGNARRREGNEQVRWENRNDHHHTTPVVILKDCAVIAYAELR